MVALGGSITAGQGVTVAQDSYVNRLFRWVEVCCPAGLKNRQTRPTTAIACMKSIRGAQAQLADSNGVSSQELWPG